MVAAAGMRTLHAEAACRSASNRLHLKYHHLLTVLSLTQASLEMGLNIDKR